MAAPASPPGGYEEPGDGEGGGSWRVSAKEKVGIMQGKRSGLVSLKVKDAC